MSISDHATPAAVLVPEDRRDGFLPTLFGLRQTIIAENAVYTFMSSLSPQDYGGGFWDFYEYEGKPLYLVPTSKPRFRIASENGYAGEVSADAAGIIATLYALSHLSFRYKSNQLAAGYGRLHAYAATHPEASQIFQAID